VVLPYYAAAHNVPEAMFLVPIAEQELC
jgi:hypothetical protein